MALQKIEFQKYDNLCILSVDKFLLGYRKYFFQYQRLTLYAKASYLYTKLLQINGIILFYGDLNRYYN